MKRSGLVMDFGLLGIGKKCTFEVTYIEPHTLFSFCTHIPKRVFQTVFISDLCVLYGSAKLQPKLFKVFVQVLGKFIWHLNAL